MTAGPDGPPTIVILRRPLPEGGAWGPARSWFGGRPALGDAPWPRGEGGRPMAFAAQIDLSEAAEVSGVALPAGSLAAFVASDMDRLPGRLVHVPPGAAPADPPDDMEPVGAVAAGEDPAAASARLHPYWPVELWAPPVADETALADAVAGRVGAGAGRFPSREVLRAAPVVWHCALAHVAEWRRVAAAEGVRRAELDGWLAAAEVELAPLEAELAAASGIWNRLLGRKPSPALMRKLEHHRARVARLRGRRARFDAQMAELPAHLAELESWVAGQDPWEPMPEADVARLEAAHARIRKDFGEVALARVRSGLLSAVAESLRAMAWGDARARAALPPGARAELDAGGRVPGEPPHLHRMFGEGLNIQEAAAANEGNVLLLQLVYDSVMQWIWGDMGAYQFWLGPEDFAAGRLDRAHATFECH